MNDMRVLCDREDCHKPNAVRHHLFKERKPDGAGSSEDWFYVFDLCAEDSNELLNDILEEMRYRAVSDDFIMNRLRDKGIKTRVE